MRLDDLSEALLEKYENRLETFQSWPSESPAFIKDLVEAGFVYTGQDDIVFCCRCKKVFADWKDGESPLQRHKSENGSCSYLLDRETFLQSGQMPSHVFRPCPGESFESSTATGPGPEASIRQTQTLEEANAYQNTNPNILFVNNSTLHINLDEDDMEIRRTGNFDQSRRNADVPKLIIPTMKYEPSIQRNLSPKKSPSPYTHQQHNMSPQFSEVTSHTTSAMHQQQTINPQSAMTITPQTRAIVAPQSRMSQSTSPRPHVNTYSSPNILEQPSNRNSSPNILNQPYIRNGNMANKIARLHTFLTWPQEVRIEPLELAEAGFYYLGKDDGVKCYRCEIALRNWEDEDKAWTEHTKWSPNCPLVIEHNTNVNAQRQISTHQVTQNPLSASSYALPTEDVFRSPRLSPNTLPQANPQHQPDFQLRQNSPNLQSFMPHYNSHAPHINDVPMQSGFQMHGVYNTMIDERVQGQPRSYSGISQQENHMPQTQNQNLMSGFKELFSEKDIENLFDAGFTVDKIIEVQNAGFQKYHAYFTSVETIADAIMHYMEHGNLDTHTVPPSNASNTNALEAAGQDEQDIVQTSAQKPAQNQTNESRKSEETKKEEIVDLQRELDRAKEMQMCKICMDQQVGVVFFPCGHLLTCPSCSTGMEQCPLCRATIESSSRIYLS